ncbi:MAG TPA: hypothetical protein VL181_10490, partial [Holophagaceae bacterium]|nr:hypothetical protein [Holophagaceae bacterium]
SQANGPAIEVRPQASTKYTLTATNAAGGTVSRDLLVKVVPPPAIKSLQGQGAIGFGQAVTVIGQFSGGKAELKRGNDVIASSEDGSLQTQVPSLKEGDIFTLVVTNEAGDSVARTLNFNSAPAVAAPQK